LPSADPSRSRAAARRSRSPKRQMAGRCAARVLKCPPSHCLRPDRSCGGQPDHPAWASKTCQKKAATCIEQCLGGCKPLGDTGTVFQRLTQRVGGLGLSHTVAKKDTSPHQPEGTRNEGTSVLHQVPVTPQGARRHPQQRRSTGLRRSVATRPSGHQVCTTAHPKLRKREHTASFWATVSCPSVLLAAPFCVPGGKPAAKLRADRPQRETRLTTWATATVACGGLRFCVRAIAWRLRPAAAPGHPA
jgi:hypothetical protein